MALVQWCEMLEEGEGRQAGNEQRQNTASLSVSLAQSYLIVLVTLGGGGT